MSWNLLTRSDALLTCPAGMLKMAPYGEQVSRIPLAMSLPSITLGILTLRDNPLSLAATRLAGLFRSAIANDARLA
ncbi:hypothetical protein ACU4GI_05010 [Cupriavidus basilensis]